MFAGLAGLLVAFESLREFKFDDGIIIGMPILIATVIAFVPPAFLQEFPRSWPIIETGSCGSSSSFSWSMAYSENSGSSELEMKVVQCWDDGIVDDIRLTEILRRYVRKPHQPNPG